MARFLFGVLCLLTFFYLVRFLIRDMFSTKKKSEHEELVEDPSCKVYIPKSSALRRKIRGKEQYFCSRECLDKFLETR